MNLQSLVASRLTGRPWAIAPGRLEGLLGGVATLTAGDDLPPWLQERSRRQDYTVTDSVIAVVPIVGPLVARGDWLTALLGASEYAAVADALTAAAADPSVRGILLEVDSPGGEVWSKAPKLVRLYAEGAVIRSKAGLFLAIPTPAAGRYGDARRKITPGAWERIHGLRLRFVYRRGSPSLLVADNARLTKRGRAEANSGRSKGAAFTRLSGRTTVPLFILVPQVSVRKRLDVEGAAQKWMAALPQLVLRNWREERS